MILGLTSSLLDYWPFRPMVTSSQETNTTPPTITKQLVSEASMQLAGKFPYCQDIQLVLLVWWPWRLRWHSYAWWHELDFVCQAPSFHASFTLSFPRAVETNQQVTHVRHHDSRALLANNSQRGWFECRPLLNLLHKLRLPHEETPPRLFSAMGRRNLWPYIPWTRCQKCQRGSGSSSS